MSTTTTVNQHRKWGTIHKRRSNGENACGNVEDAELDYATLTAAA